MKTLLQVATRLGQLTAIKAPRRTGNLKSRLREANTGRNILSGMNSAQAEKRIIDDLRNGTNTFEFAIDVAPPGAEYGQWWNDPTVSETVRNQRTGNDDKINFGEQAINSNEFQNLLDDYIESLTEKIAVSVARQIDEELK